MNKPAEYDVAHPIWLRGREYGIAEERENILATMRDQFGTAQKPDQTNATEVAFYEGYVCAMIIALDCIEGIKVGDE